MLKYKGDSKVLQYFGNMRHNSAGLDIFAAGHEDNEPHWTVRYWACLILSECYLMDLTLWLRAEFMVLGLPDLIWSLRLLQLEWNFLKHLVCVLWLAMSSSFAQQMFLVDSATLYPSLNLSSKSSQIRLCCLFICEAFKSHTEWSNAQHVSTPITMILPTTVSTFHGLNCFGHVIYELQTSLYQNIVKLLTQPCIILQILLDEEARLKVVKEIYSFIKKSI